MESFRTQTGHSTRENLEPSRHPGSAPARLRKLRWNALEVPCMPWKPLVQLCNPGWPHEDPRNFETYLHLHATVQMVAVICCASCCSMPTVFMSNNLLRTVNFQTGSDGLWASVACATSSVSRMPSPTDGLHTGSSSNTTQKHKSQESGALLKWAWCSPKFYDALWVFYVDLTPKSWAKESTHRTFVSLTTENVTTCNASQAKRSSAT